MRYRVEFLREPTEEQSVCHARAMSADTIDIAQMQALAWSGRARNVFGAGGFQIRDLDDQGRIVALEEFVEPPPAVH